MHTNTLTEQFRKGLVIADPDAVRTVLTLFWLLAEPARLLSGYAGNLGENVPWLVVFAALTLAPQTAVCYYMMLAQWVRQREREREREIRWEGGARGGGGQVRGAAYGALLTTGSLGKQRNGRARTHTHTNST